MAPLGPDYASVVQRAFNERWIDLFPNEGKRSGAYSNGGAYDVHPYMLINYNGKYDDMSTLAHELGHTMHSYYSNKTQPYALAAYPTFVAEVASTFNESLLIDHMLGQIKDEDTRLSLLGNYLENIKGTVFRQTQFAEFELRMHEMAQRGEPITGDALAKLYLDITKRYYGHDQGVCIVDDYVAHEWSYIPHFYRDFYVFQYATSFTASSALAEKVKAGGAGAADATKRYLTFLGSGGSKYPIDLLKDAGVDMTTDEPLELTDARDEPGDGRDGEAAGAVTATRCPAPSSRNETPTSLRRCSTGVRASHGVVNRGKKADLVEQLVDMPRETSRLCAAMVRAAGEARNGDDGLIRVPFHTTQRVKELESVHAGHLEIADDQIDVLGHQRLQASTPSLAVRTSAPSRSSVREVASRESSTSSTRRIKAIQPLHHRPAPTGPDPPLRSLRREEANRHLCATAALAGDRRLALGLHQRLDQREADARPACVRRCPLPAA